MEIIYDGSKYVIAKLREPEGMTHLYLRLDGTWAQVFLDDPACARFDTREEATAYAMGHGLIPMDFLIEGVLLDDASKLNKLANKCLELKAMPYINGLLKAGKRKEAIAFARQVPIGDVSLAILDHAMYGNAR